MKVRLTKNLIDRIQPAAKRQIILDSEVSGLALYVTGQFLNDKGEVKGGHKSFYFNYNLGRGVKRQLHLGPYPELTVQKARLKVQELKVDIACGRDPASRKTEMSKDFLTVDYCLDKFFREYVDVYLKKFTAKAYYSFRKTYISPTLGHRDVISISFQDLSQLHKDLKDKPTSANRVLALCSKFLNWCEKEGFRARGSASTKGIERYQEKPILKFLSVDQLNEIWDTIIRLEKDNNINLLPATALKILMLTGARKNEILGLKWSEIEFDKGRAVLQDSKTGFKVLYLPEQVLDLLNTLPRESEFAFPSRSVSGHLFDLQWQWRQVLKEAKLEGRWRIHDLRHGFASAAVNNGGSLPFIGFLLGHKRARTTERYAHVAEHPAQALLNQVAKSIIPALAKGN
ncbi:MAG: site-specific integrase [Deltaproteobacteria bacterium]|jgi:integrase|nr:site-specific integrase [Deltaproteobacteria bacterium]